MKNYCSVVNLIKYINYQVSKTKKVSEISDFTKLYQMVIDHFHFRFHNANMRYRANLPLVLKNVSFVVKPREKIGIVGRTGSGEWSSGVCIYCII